MIKNFLYILETFVLIITLFPLQSLVFIPEDLLHGKIPKSVKKLASFYAMIYTIVIIFYTAAVLLYFVIDRPGIKDKMIITTAVYPFEINSHLLKTILFFNQFFVILSTVCIPYYDGLVVFLIFVCIYRLKMLESQFSRSTSKTDLKNCIREHANVLW